MKSNDFMRSAINEAKEAKTAGDLPFGAVVVCKDQIVGRGKAENNTQGDVTDHAELLAIRKACRKLGTNEPCNMCAAAIFQANIPEVIIGASRDDLPQLLRPRKIRVDHLASDSGHEIKITRGILKDQVLELFSDVKK